MTALARRRIRTHARRDPLLGLLAGIANTACWLAGLIPQPRTIERYTACMPNDQSGCYDDMTPREHDECGAFWSYCEGDPDFNKDV